MMRQHETFFKYCYDLGDPLHVFYKFSRLKETTVLPVNNGLLTKIEILMLLHKMVEEEKQTQSLINPCLVINEFPTVMTNTIYHEYFFNSHQSSHCLATSSYRLISQLQSSVCPDCKSRKLFGSIHEDLPKHEIRFPEGCENFL